LVSIRDLRRPIYGSFELTVTRD